MTSQRAVCFIFLMLAAAGTATPSNTAAQQAAARRVDAAEPEVSAQRPATYAGRYSMSPIVGEELRSAVQTNVYDLVRAVRPRWTSRRGQGSFSAFEGVRVYVDGHPADGLAILRSIHTSHVRSVTYLDASAATMRWGIDHPNGAIVVSMRAGV